MIDPRILEKAVAEGVIDAGQAERIAAIAAGIVPPEAPVAAGEFPAPASRPVGDAPLTDRGAPDMPRDPENLRFVRGFADIFVTIGIFLLIGPAIYFSDIQFRDTGMVAATIAAGTWLLAEYFTRRRMMALPSIVLLCIFAASTTVFFVDLLGAVDSSAMRWIPGINVLMATPPELDLAARSLAIRSAIAAVLTAITVTAYYARFRVPIAVAAGAGAVVALLLSAVAVAVPALSDQEMRWLVAGCGGLVFVLAMYFDMGDPQRLTRRTDIAFWLHVLAAPLIVHPLLLTVLGGDADAIDADQAKMVLLLFGAVAIVSVLIDRRSFLVAGLGYAGYAFGSLLGAAGVDESALPGTLLALGVLILILSAAWSVLRRVLMTFVPALVSRRLPPAHA